MEASAAPPFSALSKAAPSKHESRFITAEFQCKSKSSLIEMIDMRVDMPFVLSIWMVLAYIVCFYFHLPRWNSLGHEQTVEFVFIGHLSGVQSPGFLKQKFCNMKYFFLHMQKLL